jgi:ABC-type branched-subunit amino acid transport system substrate-binding protein
VIVAGVSLSLSGGFRLQGQEGLDALRLWADHIQQAGGMAVGPSGPRLPLRVIALDDGSRAERARENVLRLLTEDRVDLLLGPYSSGLTRAVAPLAEGHGKILWNHGGSSDAIADEGWRHVVSVPSPASDYLRALPLLVKRQDPTVTRMSVVHAVTGTFAAHVASGVTEAAKAAAFEVVRLIPFESPLRDARALLAEALAGEPDLLVGAGRFQDDVTMVRRRDLLGGVKRLAFVGAGLEAFYEEVGDHLAEDVIGPSQWEPEVHDPPRTGPTAEWFRSEFEKRFHRRPGYPAAQAFALGVVIMECLRRAGSLEDEALLSAARGLDTTTLYGRFLLDPLTPRQIGHRVLLVQWRNGRKVVIAR